MLKKHYFISDCSENWLQPNITYCIYLQVKIPTSRLCYITTAKEKVKHIMTPPHVPYAPR